MSKSLFRRSNKAKKERESADPYGSRAGLRPNGNGNVAGPGKNGSRFNNRDINSVSSRLDFSGRFSKNNLQDDRSIR